MANKILGKLSKGLSAAGKVMSVFDAVAMVDKVSKNTAPILEKAIDRHYDHQKELIALPDVIHLTLLDAQNHLEEQGFMVHPIAAKPNQIKKHHHPNEVVAMVPKSGKFKPGTLVKLYYRDADVIDQSDSEVQLPVLKDMFLEDALALLEKKGLTASKIIARPKKELATEQAGIVVDSDPKPGLLTKTVKPGTVVRVIYLTDEVIAASQTLLDDYRSQQTKTRATVETTIDQLKERFKR